MTLVRAFRLAIPGRLDPVDLFLAAGEVVAVVGRNGAGKTSLLRALAGVGGATVRGFVEVAGEPLADAGPARRPFLLGYLPASRELAWPLRVRDLVALGLTADDDRVDAALRRFELDRFAERRADRLSTGERTRALLARALAPAPPLLLLDEPLANLDPDWRLRLGELLREEADAGRAVVATLHDLDTAERLADRLLVVAAGRVIADGAPAEVLAREEVQASFGLRRVGGAWTRA